MKQASQTNLTQAQAINAMKYDSAQVRHKSFKPGEYIFLDDHDRLRDELNSKLEGYDERGKFMSYWKDKKCKKWQLGWSYFQTKKQKTDEKRIESVSGKLHSDS